jgi:hypothetical protein
MPAQRSISPSPKSGSKPYTRPSRSSRPKTYIDIDDSDDEPDYDKPPALSSPSSDGNDHSSDYEPDIETPTKIKGNNNQLYSFDDGDEEEDVKPDFSDDEISYPGIVKEEHDDEDAYGEGSKGKGKGKGKGKELMCRFDSDVDTRTFQYDRLKKNKEANKKRKAAELTDTAENAEASGSGTSAAAQADDTSGQVGAAAQTAAGDAVEDMQEGGMQEDDAGTTRSGDETAEGDVDMLL